MLPCARAGQRRLGRRPRERELWHQSLASTWTPLLLLLLRTRRRRRFEGDRIAPQGTRRGLLGRSRVSSSRSGLGRLTAPRRPGLARRRRRLQSADVEAQTRHSGPPVRESCRVLPQVCRPPAGCWLCCQLVVRLQPVERKPHLMTRRFVCTRATIPWPRGGTVLVFGKK